MGIILEKETEEKFGYKISSLKPSSYKLVLWKCSVCSLIKEKKYRAAQINDKCLKCSNGVNARNTIEKRSLKMKEWYLTHDHPLKGTKRPQYIIDAMIRGTKNRIFTPDQRKKRSIAFAGKNNPFYGKKHSEETKKKLSDAAKLSIKGKGVNSNFYGKKPFHGKGSWYIDKDGAKIWMRSSWEIKFAQYLDFNNIKWIYEPRSFPIEYNKKSGTYSPDFFLIEENKYIEVKGWWRDDAYIKFASFKEQYPNIIIELYDEKKLKDLKII